MSDTILDKSTLDTRRSEPQEPSPRCTNSSETSARTPDGERRKLRFFRLADCLKPYLPILGTGLDLLLSSWEFPEFLPGPKKLTRVWLTATMEEQIAYLAKHAGMSATAVVAAALCRAQHSKIRPPRRVTSLPAE